MRAYPIDLTLELRPSKQSAGEIRWTNPGSRDVLNGQAPKRPCDGDNIAAERPSSLSYNDPIVGIPRAAGSVPTVHATQHDALNPSDRARVQPDRLTRQDKRVKDAMKFVASCSASVATTRCDSDCERAPFHGRELSWQLINRGRNPRLLNG
jgi:hypothetical protein